MVNGKANLTVASSWFGNNNFPFFVMFEQRKPKWRKIGANPINDVWSEKDKIGRKFYAAGALRQFIQSVMISITTTNRHKIVNQCSFIGLALVVIK